jgi:hypothetical protein
MYLRELRKRAIRWGAKPDFEVSFLYLRKGMKRRLFKNSRE